MPADRRARSLAAVYAGYSMGTVAGLLLTPLLADAFRWPAALHAFSAAGLAWAVSVRTQTYSWYCVRTNRMYLRRCGRLLLHGSPVH